jgi:CBS domain-containing protein
MILEISRAVASLLQEDIVSVEPRATVSALARLMVERSTRNVFVMREGEPVGLVRDWDIVRRVVALNLNPEVAKVEEIMCAPVASVNANAELSEIAARMAETGARRVLVTLDEKVVGTITAGSLLSIVSHFPDMTANETLRSIAGLNPKSEGKL